jgi:hypothetical protein
MFFVSSEQIHANFLAAVNHYFNPIEENVDQKTMLAAFLPEGWEFDEPKQSTEDNIWQPVIWSIELMPIEEEDLKRQTFLMPFHKKFKILSGPCMGKISYDDGTDIFETIDEAQERATMWVDERLSKLEKSINLKFVPEIKLS